jgi:hypothetical protein
MPEALGCGADVDLEDLLHLVLHSVLEAEERDGPRLGVLADPAIVDDTDRDRIEEVELFRDPAPLGDHEPCLLNRSRCFITADPRHRETLGERAQRLPVLAEEVVEQTSSGRVGKRFEHDVHVLHYM